MHTRFVLTLLLSTTIMTVAVGAEPLAWKKGQGWGWVWGENDEVGSLNEITPTSILSALSLVKKGEIRDLGILYSRESYKWPGHSPGEIMTFRSPNGVRQQGDLPPYLPTHENNASGTAFHSCALFISDNVATQIDGLAHIVVGEDRHWYNGFAEDDWGGDWGVRKSGAETIPPIIARGVLIDVAGFKGVDALPSKYTITTEDLQGALKQQHTELQFGDVVLIRTGALRYWAETGSDHKKLDEHDSAGIQLPAARWLVEQQGAIMIGSDTSGLEQYQSLPEGATSPTPVHEYLLVEQGVHIGEFHYLEDLAREKVYEFTYMATTNKIKGATAGFTMRPLAIY
jgi:kynurenine formamidase